MELVRNLEETGTTTASMEAYLAMVYGDWSWWWVVIGVLGFNTLVCIYAHWIDRLCIVDISWGVMTIVSTTLMVVVRKDVMNIQMLLVYALLLI